MRSDGVRWLAQQHTPGGCVARCAKSLRRSAGQPSLKSQLKSQELLLEHLHRKPGCYRVQTLRPGASWDLQSPLCEERRLPLESCSSSSQHLSQLRTPLGNSLLQHGQPFQNHLRWVVLHGLVLDFLVAVDLEIVVVARDLSFRHQETLIRSRPLVLLLAVFPAGKNVSKVTLLWLRRAFVIQ